MNLVGTLTPPCETLIIGTQDRIVYIDAESDKKHLRRLIVHLASGSTSIYGRSKDFGYPKMRFDFTENEKNDILGIYGWVAPDPDTKGERDHIVSLGFMENRCPARGVLDYESSFKKMSTTKFLSTASTDNGVAIAVIMCLLAIVLITVIYCCLKNRGRICQKGGA